MSPQERLYHRVTGLFSIVIVGFGLVILIRSITLGAGALSAGILLGLLFTALGVGRLYVARKGLR